MPLLLTLQEVCEANDRGGYNFKWNLWRAALVLRGDLPRDSKSALSMALSWSDGIWGLFEFELIKIMGGM
jgi:hypothetical protein